VGLYSGNLVALQFMKALPLTSEANNIGGEIYFRTNGVDLAYDDSQKEEFDIGDIVYWRSPSGEDKFAIALFYGNTQYGNWQSIRASSPCIKIGHFLDTLEGLESIQTGDCVRFHLKPQLLNI